MSNTDSKNKGSNNSRVFTLGTEDSAIIKDDIIGQIQFKAPRETDGGDAIKVSSSIAAVAESEFTNDNNKTKLSFRTAASEIATEKMTIDSQGNLKLSGDLISAGTTCSIGGSTATISGNIPSAQVYMNIGNNTAPYTLSVGSSTSYVVPFDKEVYDSHNSFSTTTYKYTIPFTGKYLVTINFYINYSSGIYGKLALMKSGSPDTAILHSNTWGQGGNTMSGIFDFDKDTLIYLKNITTNSDGGSLDIDLGGGETYTTMSICMINYGTMIGKSLAFSGETSGTIMISNTAENTVGKTLSLVGGSTTAGTTNNIAGGALILEGGKGKGNNTGGGIDINVYNSGVSGNSLNKSITALTVNNKGYIGLGNPNPEVELDINGNVKVTKTDFDESTISGRVGHWTFNGNANDISGNGYNGTVNGAILTSGVNGVYGTAYQFDGSDDYINVPHNDNLDILETLTVSCWFKCTGTISNEMNLIEKDTWDGNFLHFIKSSKLAGASANFSSPSATIGTASGNTMFGVTTLVSNIWYHSTSTYEKISSTTTKVSLYLNGTLDGQVTFNGVLDGDANEALLIGGRASPYNTINFPGSIDDVRIYNRILTPAEIIKIYNINREVSGGNMIVDGIIKGVKDHSPIVYFKLDDTLLSGTNVIKDSSKSGLYGSISGSFAAGSQLTTGYDGTTNGAYSFNNSTGGIYFPKPQQDLTRSWTVSIWIYLLSTPSGGSAGQSLISNHYEAEFDIIFYTNLRVYSGRNGTTNYNTFIGPTSETSNFPLNTWLHVTITKDVFGEGTSDVEVKFYVNSVLKTTTGGTVSTTAVTPSTTYPFIIGGRPSSKGATSVDSTKDFNGYLDELKIYDYVLSHDEIKRLYSLNVDPDSRGIKVKKNGLVGIGIRDPVSKLHVNGDIKNSTTVVSFTGGHDIQKQNLNNFSENDIGKILSSTGNYSHDIEIYNSIPFCQLSTIENDNTVYGVLSQELLVNSLGEGCIWVSNKNGNLEIGDYITSSSIKGYGVKQVSEEGTMKNYTVAKMTCDCDFSLIKTVKRKIKYLTDNTPDYDSSGNLQYEDDLDSDGNQQSIYNYQTRFLDSNGEELTGGESDYTTRLANSESVYIACFVGCTYHCG